ncbi:MAG: acetyl-CoA carboxylase biotin carboxyl carrier protein [Gemmatimonadota bacterium]|nr:acetyl-CoA carboxylase biotin carboxyl carrier protein [Gemmatimonadota bacterium]
MIDFRVLEKLLDLLNGSDAQTIEVRKSFWTTTVKVSKTPESSGPVTYQVAAGQPQAAPLPPAHSGAGAVQAPSGEQDAASKPDTGNLVEIKSPMVGTFYAKPDPDSDPYVAVGKRVSPGTTLCIIEAMKIMNPLDSEVSGTIVEVVVEDAQPVEFGQVLFRVDPNV